MPDGGPRHPGSVDSQTYVVASEGWQLDVHFRQGRRSIERISTFEDWIDDPKVLLTLMPAPMFSDEAEFRAAGGSIDGDTATLTMGESIFRLSLDPAVPGGVKRIEQSREGREELVLELIEWRQGMTREEIERNIQR